MKAAILTLLILCACRAPEELLVGPCVSEGRIENPGQEFEEVMWGLSDRSSDVTEFEPVATLLGEPIRSTNEILRALIKRYQLQNDIYITESEVDECIASYEAFMTSQAGSEEPLPRYFAEHMLIQFKVDKALYEQYGGPVIFQQFHPRDPVGAYGALLREREALGEFRFLDEKLAAKYWDYFERDHGHWVIDPADLDMSTPWWTQELDSDE